MSQSEKSRRHFDDAFKMSVVEEAIQGTQSKYSLCKKYSIASTSTLRSWIRIFAPEYELNDGSMKKSPVSENEEILALRRMLQEKELCLKREKMRADFLDEMINVAEEKFQLPIRKKAGTKR